MTVKNFYENYSGVRCICYSGNFVAILRSIFLFALQIVALKRTEKFEGKKALFLSQQ